MDKNLFHQLCKFTDTEKSQLENSKFLPDYVEKSVMSANPMTNAKYNIPVFTEDFFKNRKIYISKHSRFADYPKHTHTFLEINYMLNGQATEIIDDKKVELNKGDILILDIGTTHSIKALSKSDILMNIIFRNDIDFSLKNLRNLGSGKSILSKFLLANKQFSKYLLYRSSKTEKNIQIILDQIIEEYFRPGSFSNQLLDSYLDSFLILLSRNTNLNTNIFINKKVSTPVLFALKEVSQNYQHTSLSKIATKANYNRAYLGNLFKKETGKTFSDALTEQRLLTAYDFLNSTSMSISEIMEKIGISNRTFFYKKFKEKFHQTPNEIRLREIN